MENNNITIRDYIDTRLEAIIMMASQRFDAQQLALKDALMAQEKGTSLALVNTEKAIDKASAGTDKRFDELSEKISTAIDTINKSSGAQGIYVTHSDLSVFGDKLQTSFEEALKPLVSQVNILTNAQNNQQGRSSGFSASWGIIIGAVGLTSTIILLTLRLMGK
jgi:DNA anti-recombination protein RmuC